MLTTAIHDNSVGGHSICAATNNNDNARLYYLERILPQHIKSSIQTNNQTNKKINSLTSKSADNENNNDEYASLIYSIN